LEIGEIFYYRNIKHQWVFTILEALEEIPDSIFFEKDGSPLKKEVIELDRQINLRLNKKFKGDVKYNEMTMFPENNFEMDIILPTKPQTLIEIEKGKLPRLELDLMKIVNTIFRYPRNYGYGCLVVPFNYINLILAGRRSPFQFLKVSLIPLN
jgi:hypothetical protein